MARAADRPVFLCDAPLQNCHAVPIDVGLDAPVYLELFGTGISGGTNYSVTVGGQSVPVLYAAESVSGAGPGEHSSGAGPAGSGDGERGADGGRGSVEPGTDRDSVSESKLSLFESGSSWNQLLTENGVKVYFHFALGSNCDRELPQDPV